MASSPLLTLLLTCTIVATATIYKEKTTSLNFFVRAILSGPDATDRVVVQPLNNSTIFGQISVVDNELRRGPEATSELVGRSRGFLVGTSMEGSTLYSAANLVFSEGQYSGSTLVVVGRSDFRLPFVLSIIGGTGRFRMGRGYAVFRPVQPPMVYEVDALVLHH